MMIFNNNEKVLESKRRIKEVYQKENMPFIIAYSGGKDSTALLHLFLEALLEMRDDNIELKNEVIVISSDTLVENPLVEETNKISMKKIRQFGVSNNLPLKVSFVKPKVEDTFFVKLFGNGYPVPNQEFRWCTDRLKIKPIDNFIRNVNENYEKVIIAIGTRKGESISRDRVIKKRSLKTNYLSPHGTQKNSFVFAPIIEFNTEDVWSFLLNNESIIGLDNNELYKMYSESSEECPIVADGKQNTKSCGNSRFGCWTCTVVSEDKSLTGFIQSGKEELIPLLKYRNYLVSTRENRTMREKNRTNGSYYFVDMMIKDNKLIKPAKGKFREKAEYNIDELNKHFTIINEYDFKEEVKKINLEENDILIKKTDGSYAQLGLGPYSIDARCEMLKKLLEIQRDTKYTLITDKELFKIEQIWRHKGYWKHSVTNIYNQIFNENKNFSIESIVSKQLELLPNIEENTLSELKELIILSKERNLTKKDKVGKIKKILTKEIYHT